MARIEAVLQTVADLDASAGHDTWVRNLDARVKVLTTLAFILMVTSFDKYEVLRLLPLIVYPLALVSGAALPVGPLLRQLLLASPFVFFIAILNPLLDRSTTVPVGSLEIPGGWMSFASVLFRFALSVLAALILVATTGFYRITLALKQLGVPQVFVVQLLFLFRYLFVLVDEAARTVRAYTLRSGGRRIHLAVLGPVLGQWLLRTLDRAHRVHLAMCCRGFEGVVKLPSHRTWGWPECAFLLGWLGYFVMVRSIDVPQVLGDMVMGVLQ